MKHFVALAGVFVCDPYGWMRGLPRHSATSSTVTGPGGEILSVNPDSGSENFRWKPRLREPSS